MNLNNKVAIVTGASRGIGAAIASRFARLGAKVVVDSRDWERANIMSENIRKDGFITIPVKADVSVLGDVKELFRNAESVFGPVDILVNNAGIFYPSKFEDISSDEWDRVLGINLKGVYYCSKEAYISMKKRRYGKILNISSIAGVGFLNHPGGAHYVASKAGIIGLAKQLAKEAAQYNINVNVICPGPTKTAVFDYMDKEAIKKIESKIPMGRFCEPSEVADLAAFLCSDSASYITGAIININGGIQALYP